METDSKFGRFDSLKIFILLFVMSCSNESIGQTIERAAAEYLGALADRTYIRYLAHERLYQQREVAERNRVPTSIWPERQAALQREAVSDLQGPPDRPYGLGTRCRDIVRPGAQVEVQEIRPLSSSQWQVFYNISYSRREGSPTRYVLGGKERFFRSGEFSVPFELARDGKTILADSKCTEVTGLSTIWPVPILEPGEAISISRQTNDVFSSFRIDINGRVGSGSSQKSWQEFIATGDAVKGVLEKHGWTVDGYERPSFGYYSYGGNIFPPESAQNLIARGRFGYSAVFLEQAEILSSKTLVQDDKATLSVEVKYSGCTVYCELWKEVRTMPIDVGRTIFVGQFGKYNPAFDLDAVITMEIEFAWTASKGWYLVE